MYRRVVLSSPESIGGPFGVLYHVRGARLLSQARVSTRGYDVNFSTVAETGAAVFADSVRLQTAASIGSYRTYEFILDVDENQPVEESVDEITSTGVGIYVYNEHGVLVCSKPHANG